MLLLLELPGCRILDAGTEVEILGGGWRCRNGCGSGHADRGGGCGCGAHLLEELLMSEVLLLALRRILLQQSQLGLLIALLSPCFESFLEFEDF